MHRKPVIHLKAPPEVFRGITKYHKKKLGQLLAVETLWVRMG